VSGGRGGGGAAVVRERILADGVLAIFRHVAPVDAPALAADLVDGGVRLLEVPLTEPAALDTVRALRGQLGDRAVVGAGSLRDAADVEAATEAGAEFVVSAGFFDEVAKGSAAADRLYLPGVLSASEVGRALAGGYDLLKLFPAGVLGAAYLAALLGPFPDAKLIAVGSLDRDRLLQALDAGAAGVALGSAVLWLPRAELRHLVAELRDHLARRRAGQCQRPAVQASGKARAQDTRG
jgi:2-dehydro-3-deoxyphosphogluconate aldolase / (4S)-4-hydroxy-2-oxoglutarate aldolase